MILGIDASQANRRIRSGTEWYAWHLLQEFKKELATRQNLEIRLYVRDELQADLAENLPANFKVKILRWPFRFFWGQLRLSLEMFLHPPDVLFCPAHTIPLVHPQRTYTTLHDVGFEDYPELYDKLSLWYHRFSAWLAVRKAWHIFTVSEFSKERIIENYTCDQDRISVTHLGIAPYFSAEKFQSIVEKYDLEAKNYILYIGRIEPKKNILNMIEAYKIAAADTPRNDDFPKFVIVGRKLMDLPEVSGIKLLDYIEEDEKWALLAGAKMFLFTTMYEGFGLPILEAQVVDTPVITSNTASNPEIAGDGAVLAHPDSPHEIAKAIKLINADDNLRQGKIRLGLENIKRFSWQTTARQTLDKLLS